MRKFRNTDGSSRFHASSYNFSASCKFFSFSCLASKKVVQADEYEDEEDEHAEELNKIHEQNIQDLSNKIMRKYYFSIRSPYEISKTTHNIRKIADCSKFSVQMLQVICCFFRLDISTINVKRKKPYIVLLTNSW